MPDFPSGSVLFPLNQSTLLSTELTTLHYHVDTPKVLITGIMNSLHIGCYVHLPKVAFASANDDRQWTTTSEIQFVSLSSYQNKTICDGSNVASIP